MGLSVSDDEHKKTVSRRAFIIGAAQGGVITLLAGRLGWLQLAQGNRYKTLSDKNRIDLKMLAPSRGRILDRMGKELATNTQNFRVLITPERAENPDEALKNLQKLINLGDDEIARAKDTIGKVAKFASVEVTDQLTWEELSTIEVNLPDLPGMSIDVGEIRSYPLGDATAHIVGYVGAPNETEVTRDPVFSLPGFKIGKTGIEKQLDTVMRGKAGLSEVEVNVTGREVRELDRQPSLTGQDITLTIDADLQNYVQTVLAREKSSSAIVMDAQTGAVYALASHPAFDPNLFIKGMSAETWEGLLATPGYPLTNKAVSGQYPPASTFKMVTALAALEEGVIDAKTTFFCPGHYEYGGQKFHCWKTSGHGWVDLKAALAQSCDVYFYEIATKIGIDKIAETARKMGLGEKLGIELGEERAGLVPDKNWKMGYFGEPWKSGESIVASIGQGYLQSTPLQLAAMTARLVNGGKAVAPHLVVHGEGPQQMPKDLKIDPAHLELIKRGMDAVVNNKKGTAYKSRIEEPHMAYGGKTGTAQVKRITAAQRRMGVQNEDLPWKQRHHALFVGYAPLSNPRYICSVVVEHGVGGSKAAAPIARDILRRAQQINPAQGEGEGA